MAAVANKLTLEQNEEASRLADEVWSGKRKTRDVVDELADHHGLNRSSALFLVMNYQHMMKGEVFKRAMSEVSGTVLMRDIASRYGSSAVKVALEALSQHVAYYERCYPGQRAGSMRKVMEAFSRDIESITLPKLADFDASQEATLIAAFNDSAEVRRRRLARAPKRPASRQVTTTVFVRNQDVVAEVLIRAAGHCERCEAPAPFKRASSGQPYLEVHHRIRLADGGDDTVDNALALCPNCHRESHYG